MKTPDTFPESGLIKYLNISKRSPIFFIQNPNMPKIGEKGQWDTFDKKGEVILIKISKGTVPAYFAGIFFVRVYFCTSRLQLKTITDKDVFPCSILMALKSEHLVKSGGIQNKEPGQLKTTSAPNYVKMPAKQLSSSASS